MIIGLLGRSRVGKDTTASILVSILGSDNIAITRLSQPLKDAVQILYGFTHEQVEDAAKEIIDVRYNMTPRTCIQRLCDHMMKTHSVDFFSKQLFGRYDTGSFRQQHIIIPDVRYEHDIHEIRRRGGIVIKVERSGMDIPRHPWEDSIDALQGDVRIVNDKDIEWVREQVSQIVRNMKLS